MNQFRLIIPSESPGGLNAISSPHFAFCDVFCLIILKNGSIDFIYNLPNTMDQINTTKAIQTIFSLDGNILFTRGISLHPLRIFQRNGIQVYFSENLPTVSKILIAFLQKKLVPFN